MGSHLKGVPSVDRWKEGQGEASDPGISGSHAWQGSVQFSDHDSEESHAAVPAGGQHKANNMQGPRSTAFLQGGPLPEDQARYAWPVTELAKALSIPEGKACRVPKNVYGLGRAPKGFWKKVDNVMTLSGGENSVADPCVWHFDTDSETESELTDSDDSEMGSIGTHVNDFQFEGNEDNAEWNAIIDIIKKMFRWSPFKQTGLAISQHEVTKAISIDQKAYTHDMDELEIEPARKVHGANNSLPAQEISQAQGVLGSCQWVGTNTLVGYLVEISMLQSSLSEYTGTVDVLLKINKLVKNMRAISM